MPHTPEPWTADGEQPECWARIRAADDEPIADVFGLDRDDDADEAEANLNLFLAAPEMLKALKATRALDFFRFNSLLNDEQAEAMRLMNIAINKAERGVDCQAKGGAS